jgi:hypothetical protein
MTVINFMVFNMRKWLRTQKMKRKISARRSIIKKLTESTKINRLTTKAISKYKSSSTLCVLASGMSINSISEEQWDFINENDSLSLNNTILHKHVPTFIFYETDSNQERHLALNQLKFNNLFNRAKEFSKTPIIWHYQEKRYFDFVGLEKHNLLINSFFQTSYSLPGNTPEDFLYSLDYTNNNLLNNEIDVGLYRRGSLARILHFAKALNYKEIIFFGADLTGADYFFDTYSASDLPEGCTNPNLKEYTYNSSSGLKKQSEVHMTVDKTVHPVTMIDVIDKINISWLKPNNISLRIAHNSSALKEVIQVKEWL